MFHGKFLVSLRRYCLTLFHSQCENKETWSCSKIRVKHRVVKQSFLVDITFSIKCKEWPESSDWPMRNRQWPKQVDAQRIVNEIGCHLVPKSPLDDKKGIHWRYSFSKAEVELSKLVPPAARKCFIVLKIISKDYIQPTCKELTS